MNRKLFPIGIQNFEKLRKEGFSYVDKTRYVYNLVKSGSYYFLSRPRRFGKSLLLSTIEAYFQGKRELFKDLEIEQLERDWNVYPILHLDLNTQKYDSSERLVAKLEGALEDWEAIYGNTYSGRTLGMRFEGVIKLARRQTGSRVVILVDEYDKPLLQSIGNEPLQDDIRDILKEFYSALKSCDGDIQFAMLTGVTKFGKVSVFSDLNNLEDISMLPAYSEVCGITESEIRDNFESDVALLAQSVGMTYEGVFDELRTRYDGYRFCEDGKGLYNPFSLLNALKNLKLKNYWFETGTPTYLVDLLRKSHYSLQGIESVEAREDVLNSVDTATANPISMIYQSGYLTIKDYDSRFGFYTLGFPNKEVKEGFMYFLLPAYVGDRENKSQFEISQFVNEVESGNVDGFMTRLKSFFADIPYEQTPTRWRELNYQNVMFIVCKLMGLYVKTEYHTSQGRIDMLVETDRYVFVMEFKPDGSAEDAIAQIEARNYVLPFVAGGKKVFKIGVNFSSKTNTIERWIVV